MSGLNIGVIGAGLMGHGIAYLLAAAGTHGRHLRSRRRNGAIRCRNGWKARARCSTAIRRCSTAFPPMTRWRRRCRTQASCSRPRRRSCRSSSSFRRAEAVTAPTTILASNSSAIPSTEIGAKLKHRERVVGTHFWNPPHLVPLVEVIQNEMTSDETVRRTIELLRDAGRKPVHVKKDIPGFVGNRLQHALKREAIALVASGVCDAETIDEVVKNGFGARMAVLGPMEQSDLVGLDLTLDIQNVLLADLDRSTEPTQFLKDKVAAGKLGMRTGEGLRQWTPQRRRGARAAAALPRRAGEEASGSEAAREHRFSLTGPAAGVILRPAAPGSSVLGAILAVLSAATFALNNAAARRGVVTGTPIQGMAISIPMGVVCFLPVALVAASSAGWRNFRPRRRPGWRASACCISCSGATATTAPTRPPAST